MANSLNQAALSQPQPISTQLPTTQQAWQQFATTLNQWLQYLAAQNPGYNATFQSGYLMYGQPNGQIGGNGNFEVGLGVPNPSGTNGPVLLLGSGGGSGTPVTAAIIQDQSYDAATPGNNLIVTAGETQASGTANGGYLLNIAGASYAGTGGVMTTQGGTSLNGPGGSATLAGGNSTNGIAGDAFVIGGQNGTQGANVHLIMTKLGGVSGNVRIRVNSTILWQFDQYGAVFIGSTGCGTAGQTLHSGGPGAPCYWG